MTDWNKASVQGKLHPIYKILSQQTDKLEDLESLIPYDEYQIRKKMDQVISNLYSTLSELDSLTRKLKSK